MVTWRSSVRLASGWVFSKTSAVWARKRARMKILLIYGVGEHDPELIRAIVSELCAQTQIVPSQISVLDWSANVESPTEDGLLRYSYIKHLLQGIRGAAFLPVSQREATLGVCPLSAKILDFLLYLSPVVAFIVALVWLRPPTLLNARLAELRTALQGVIAVWVVGITLSILVLVLISEVQGCSTAALFRRLILLIIRPALLMFSLPLLTFIGLPIAVLLVYIVFLGHLSGTAPFESSRPLLVEFIKSLLAFVGLYAVRVAYGFFILAGDLLITRLRTLFKITADICMYLGSPGYRESVSEDFRNELANVTAAESEILIAAHSLGSVIAIDGLGRSTNSERKTTLVTMGSPLKRFFSRFFPYSVPPPDVLARAIAEHGLSFRWINVYRPRDPIGTVLGGFREQPVDFNTNQHVSVLRAHTEYWGDAQVLAQVVIGLSSVSFSCHDRGNGTRQLNEMHFGRVYDRLFPKLSQTVLPLVSVLLLTCLFAVNIRPQIEERVEADEAFIRYVDQNAREAEATIYKRVITERDYSDPPPIEKITTSFLILFRPLAGEPICSQGDISWIRVQRDKALAWESINEARDVQACNVRFSMLPRPDDEFAVASSVVRYRQDSPNQFYVPALYERSANGAFLVQLAVRTIIFVMIGIPLIWFTTRFVLVALGGGELPFGGKLQRRYSYADLRTK